MNSENNDNVDWKKESEFWKRSFLELSRSAHTVERNDVKPPAHLHNSTPKVAHNDKKRKRKPLHKKQMKLSIFKKNNSVETTTSSNSGSCQDDNKIKKQKLNNGLNSSKHNDSSTEEKILNKTRRRDKNQKNVEKLNGNQNKPKKLGGNLDNNKKLKRKQNKEKKIDAYLNIVALNNADRKDPVKLGSVETTISLMEVGRSDAKQRRALATKHRNEFYNLPRLSLSDKGKKACLKLDEETDNEDALFVVDLQTLILRAVGGDIVPSKPEWCHLTHFTRIHNVTVLLINGISTKEYKKRIEIMPNMKSIFENVVEIIPPSKYGCNIEDELFWVNLSSRFRKAFCQNQQLVEAGVEKGLLLPLVNGRSIFNINKSAQGVPKKKVVYVSPDGKCTKLSLLLNLQQMYEERFPFPGQKSKLRRNFVPTKDIYDRVSEDSPMFGLDCEMCFTTNRLNELTRVSIVDDKMTLIYDKLVKPNAPITDYLTQFSGITKEMMKDVTYTIEDVQRDIRNLLPDDAILVGQSLSSDMNALELTHPYIIDTSVIYNLTGRSKGKTGLKKLSELFLNEKIQCHGAQGHDSFEDSASALKLVLLKLGKGLKFGDVRWQKTENEKIKKVEIIEYEKIEKNVENIEPPTTDLSINLLKYVELAKKRVAVVDPPDSEIFNKAFRAFDNSVIFQVKQDTNLGICSTLEDVLNRYDLNIGHFSVTETKKKKSIKELDEIVKRVHDAIPRNGILMVVAFKPVEKEGEVSNGLCFVKLKDFDSSKIKKFD